VSRVERAISLPLPFPWEEEALADSRNIGSTTIQIGSTIAGCSKNALAGLDRYMKISTLVPVLLHP